MADLRPKKADKKQRMGGFFPTLSLALLPLSVDPGLLVAGLLALFAVVPLLTHPGLPNTADGPVHLMRQAELNQAWKDGILYPRWAPDLAYGYGMPLFHYAPPLLYQVTQIVHLTGLPLDASMKGTIILMMFLYSIGMYLFARDLFGPRAGLLAAAVYLYAPYRLREAYIQGNYGQFCGLAFYPFILWAFHGLVLSGRPRYLPPAALSLAGLLLSHNISAMIFAPLLGAYLVLLLVLRRIETRETRKSGGQEIGGSGNQGERLAGPALADSPIRRVIIAIALGLGLSAFFWLPAFGERDLIRLAGITRGFFDFRHNFIGLAELLALPRPLDLSAINPYYPLGLGLAQMVFAGLALLGLALYGVRRVAHRRGPGGGGGRDRPSAMCHGLFFAGALLLASFLTLPSSQPIWERAPLLELAEFPWRWLGPAVLCAALLAGAVVYALENLGARGGPSQLRRAGQVGLGVGLFFTLAANLFYLFPAQFIPWGTPTPADVVAYEAQSGAIGTTSTGEFLPRWADRYPSPEVLGPDYAAGRLPTKLDPALLATDSSSSGERAVATTLAHTARETRVAVSSPVPFAATFRALYWTGWRVIVAGGRGEGGSQIIDGQITRPDGLIRVQLPAGEYQVSLRLFPTLIRRIATIISILSLLIFLGLVLARFPGWQVGRLAGRRIERSDGGEIRDRATFQSSHLPSFQAVVIGAALVVGLLVTRPLASWFRVQSPPEVAFGAQCSLRADFGDQVRLLAFDLPTCQGEVQTKAGSPLPVVLYWRALAPLATDYSVFVHLDAPDGQTYAGADELSPEDIPTSHWPPSLYLRNPLTLSIPGDLPPIRYTLTTGLYDPESGLRLPVVDCDGCPLPGDKGDALPLAHVWLLPATPMDEGDIPHRLDYRLGDKITLLGYGLAVANPPTITLYWRAGASVESGYTVFIHALAADGEIVAQFDGSPLNGLYPTDAWLPGQVIADSHTVTWPASTQALAVGLYDPDSLVRLPVTDGSGRRLPEDAIRLQVAGSK